MFVIFAFFVIVIFFKGCVSCADEAYKSYNKWHRNNSIKETKTNIYIPSQQDAHQQRQEFFQQKSPVRNERKVITYSAICPVCNGSGRLATLVMVNGEQNSNASIVMELERVAILQMMAKN